VANIVLADDNLDLLSTMGKVLRLEGHKVSSTNSGADVLCLLTRRPPHDLIILDVQMPGLTGLDVVSRLKEDDPPVILVTGSDRPLPVFPTDKVRRVLRKPFGWSKLIGTVNEVLGVPGAPGHCGENDEEVCDDD
jgi:CheY-like chemotaxis protein